MKKKPNIIFVITDSQGVNLLGKSGKNTVETPNLDKLAEEGINFERAYTTCPLCTPARAGIFTGQYPHNTGAWGNDMPLGANVRTMGEYFDRDGYDAAYIGKWHLDGFDYFGNGECAEGFDGKFWYDGRNYCDGLTEERKLIVRKGVKTAEDVYKHKITRDDTWAGGITDRAIDFLNDQADSEKPYMLVISYDEPHEPSVCPPPFCDMYTDKPFDLPKSFDDDLSTKTELQEDWANWYNLDRNTAMDQPLYKGAASFVDDEIGKVLKLVENDENTIIVFTSDHGHYIGAHRLEKKGPAMYDEVLNIPLIIKYPNVIEAGTKSSNLVSHIDILPTLLSVADIDVPETMEGRAIKEVTNESDSRKYVVSEFNRFCANSTGVYGFMPIRCIITDEYKLTINLFLKDELYDLKNDPEEMINLINDEKTKEIRNSLHKLLLEEMATSRDPINGFIWNNREWQEDKEGVSFGNKGTLAKKEDGFIPKTYDYWTGMPRK